MPLPGNAINRAAQLLGNVGAQSFQVVPAIIEPLTTVDVTVRWTVDRPRDAAAVRIFMNNVEVQPTGSLVAAVTDSTAFILSASLYTIQSALASARVSVDTSKCTEMIFGISLLEILFDLRVQ